MKIISMIPARYSASRFPGKLMQDLAGKSVILRTYEATVATELFSEVYVVTDSEIIFNEIVKNGGKAAEAEPVNHGVHVVDAQPCATFALRRGRDVVRSVDRLAAVEVQGSIHVAIEGVVDGNGEVGAVVPSTVGGGGVEAEGV